ncbi:MAG: tRNA (guanosine(46)-N7)-methyltransferase TrmB [Armatimonadota bacterium]|nr:tRNA (guanosine(46)-N7)-methyltransferase TrmB [Armatimonadota bacterium]MCX7777455.1 tRNA (guanosine(46)-N7)-methyltransferase TrmB [Armatimonadota bacterium]MDW8025537.1 tRNA (guanosine(46)-N7)-methyltransferase TrmB [Armatimonadota bacterium]
MALEACDMPSSNDILLAELELPVRPKWRMLFRRDAPIELEIGIGNGEFIAAMASMRPEHNFIGVEYALHYLRKARNRVVACGLTNVLLIHGEGGTCLSKLFSPSSLSSIYLNFPDPWEKPRHYKRRLVDEPFVCLVASRLCINGTFMMVTDSHSYAMSALELASSINALSPAVGSNGFCVGVPDGFATKYYRKWTAHGRQIYMLRFAKTGYYELPEWVSQHYPLAHLEESLPMPHVIIGGQINDWNIIASSIEVGVWVQQPMLVIKCEEVFIERDGNGLLLSMLCVEGKMQQRFIVRALSRVGETVVQIHPACRLNVTRGIQQSLGVAAQVLMRIANLKQVKRSNLGNAVHRWLGWDVGGTE